MKQTVPMVLQLAKIENGKLVLVPETLKRIRLLQRRGIKLIAVVGTGRIGKSFLMKSFSGKI